MNQVQIEVGGHNICYKCFSCLKLKNPLRKKPVIVNAITAMQPDEKGQIQMKVNAVHICPWCYKRDKLLGNFADIRDIDPNAGQTPQEPQAMVDKSTTIPNDGMTGRPGKKKEK